MEFTIPFDERFREPMLSGQKVMTSRNKKYGVVGDTFQAWGRTFVITDIMHAQLSLITREYFKEEGFDSPADLVRFWCKIHPIKGFEPSQLVHLHKFELMEHISE